MARKFKEAAAAFHHLLDLYEQQPDRSKAILAEPDYAVMTPGEAKSFHEAVDAASAEGSIEVEHCRRPDDDLIKRIRLKDPSPLFKRINRSSTGEAAPEAWARVTHGIAPVPDWLTAEGEDAITAWRAHRNWRGYPINDERGARFAVRLAVAIANGVKPGATRRAFSVEHCGYTKALEENEVQIAAILRNAFDMPSAQEGERPLQAFGIETFPDPVLLRGPFIAWNGVALSAFKTYAALSPDNVSDLKLEKPASYILTIENKESFNAYVRQEQDAGAVVFTGGFPSSAVMTVIRAIAASVGDGTPWFHWGDIDRGGVHIFRHIEKAVREAGGPAMKPHLMSKELAGAKGEKPEARITGLTSIIESDSAISDLAAWLMTPAGRVIEQELIPPACPL